MPKRFPKTFEEAVSFLLEDLDPEQKRQLEGLTEDDLILCHFGLALYVRHNYGLFRDDCPLVAGSGKWPVDADTVSNEIVREAWKRLRNDQGA